MKSQLLFITCLLCSVARGFHFNIQDSISLKTSVSNAVQRRSAHAQEGQQCAWLPPVPGGERPELAGGLRFLGGLCRPGPRELGDREVCRRPSRSGLLPVRSRSHPAASSRPAGRPPPFAHGLRLLNTQLGRFSEGCSSLSRRAASCRPADTCGHLTFLVLQKSGTRGRGLLWGARG